MTLCGGDFCSAEPRNGEKTGEKRGENEGKGGKRTGSHEEFAPFVRAPPATLGEVNFKPECARRRGAGRVRFRAALPLPRFFVRFNAD